MEDATGSSPSPADDSLELHEQLNSVTPPQGPGILPRGVEQGHFHRFPERQMGAVVGKLRQEAKWDWYKEGWESYMPTVLLWRPSPMSGLQDAGKGDLNVIVRTLPCANLSEL